MNLVRNALLSCEILAAHKMRTLLSVTGIVVGVAAVILMVSAGRGAEERILDRIRDMGTNLIVVNAGKTKLIAGRQRQMTYVATLVPGDAEAIARECASVAYAAPTVSKNMSIKWEAEIANTNVVGMASDGFHTRNIVIASGREFDAEEDRARRRFAILGATVVRNLLGDTDPIGLQIRIGRVPFEVIGVIAPKGADPNGADQDDQIIVPLETAMRRLMNLTYVQRIFAQAHSEEQLDEAEREILDLLRQRHRLRNKPDDFTIHNQATLLEAERDTSHALTLLIGSAASISLVVGGFGILAVMLISVRERRREIGLRRALGALSRDIRNQFILESAILATTSGVIGVVAGVAATMGFAGLGYWDMIISWPAVGVAFSFSITVGVVFGIYPATRAANMEPIDALRAE